MKRFVLLLWAFALLSFVSGPALAQQKDDKNQKPAPKPPRVVGQAQTQEEFTAWNTLDQAPTMQDKAKLAEEFLQKFPESGLTPLVHRMAAFSYQQMNDFDKLTHHGEKALVELPNDVSILTLLSVAYAQRGNAEQALQKAEKTVEILDALQKPVEVPQEQWDRQLGQVRADANYAMGSAYLDKFTKSAEGKTADPASDPVLTQALQHLEKALEFDPTYDLAYYRLAIAYTRKNDGPNALTNFARAVALGGPASAPAKEYLTKVHELVNPRQAEEAEEAYKERLSKSLEELIATEKGNIEKKVAAKQAPAQ
ncbi:MAG: hypothetical protein HY645_01335 [Acidobacteria bacterium]|nr:hypothetical protein [Acidobacteriota bacterium]